jgi:hypothetical protein
MADILQRMVTSAHLPGLITCPTCAAELEYQCDGIVSFFANGGRARCANCNAENDLYQVVLRGLQSNWPMHGGVASGLVGGRGFILQVRAVPGEIVGLNFENLGLPVSATVIDVNYTPQGDAASPVELHSNQPVRIHPRGVQLYMRPMRPDAADSVIVNVYVS